VNKRESKPRDEFISEIEAGLCACGLRLDENGLVRVWVLSTTQSTMSDVKMAREGKLHDPFISFSGASKEGGGSPVSIVIAEEQLAGRGRNGRKWHSARKAGIYASFLFELGSHIEMAAGASLAAGVALVECAQSVSGTKVHLKWPNDLVCRISDGSYKKLGGILCEAIRCSAESCELNVGIGLNLFPAEYPVDVPGISLAEVMKSQHSCELRLGSVFGELVKRVIETFDIFVRVGFEPFRERWLDASCVRQGENITIVDRAFGVITGKFFGLGASGELVLEETDGRRRLLTVGDVSGYL
jgi:BirA family transcriptional regulator, biotin operon repressor / biotin---[acetyl-CoA-carboxylase] ligase